MLEPKFIILHTAAHGNSSAMYDTSAAEIDRWHKQRGWKGIGYHFVVRLDGTVEEGRALDEVGAHAKGMNRKSIGICFSGHGDYFPLSAMQIAAGKDLVARLCRQFGIESDHVIGHRDINRFVAAQYHTDKTCPGRRVDVSVFRAQPDIAEVEAVDDESSA